MAETCARCAASFGSAADLIAHVHPEHPVVDPGESLALNPEAERPGLGCALCGRRFGIAGALARPALSPHAPPGWPARKIPRPRFADAR